MATTSYLGGTLLNPGQDAPENTVNLLAALFAKASAGRLSVNLGGLTGNRFASVSDSANRVFTFTGTQSGAITYHLRVDNAEANNPVLFVNNSAGDVTVKLSADGTTAAGTGLVVPQGSKMLLAHDGTNVFDALATAWTAPTLLNSWQNYGSGYRNAGYRKVGDVVQVRGFVKLGTLPGAIFTLPAGFRPSAKDQFNTTANNAAAGIEVDTSGNVTAIYGSNAYFAINFSFSVLA